MPSAFEKFQKTVTATVTTAVSVGDKAVRTAAPVVRRVAEDVVARVGRKGDAPATPAARPAPVPEPAASDDPDAPVTPAAVAKNIGGPRPSAVPAAAPDPEDSPGGKLPPRH